MKGGGKKHIYLTISEHLSPLGFSPKGQESYPLFPLKYTLSQFPHQMGTLFTYWDFFAMITTGAAKNTQHKERLPKDLSVKF